MHLGGSTASQEAICVLDLVSQLGRFAFDTRLHTSGSDGCNSFLSNFLYYEALDGSEKRFFRASLSLGVRSASGIRSILNDFNRFIKFRCERLPIGFASVRVGLGNNNGLREDGWGVLADDGLALDAVEAKAPKKVLILMSDTGGGHRASAEAIKTAFHEEFGDEYQVFVTDLWTDHTPWPFNQLPRSYNFLVKHGTLWKMTYYASAPRVVHQSNFAATSAFIAREVAKGLMKYQPDIIISVHPLMQHVPLRILRSKGLLKKIVFTTVVTDLSTCHPTWFHKLVTRCYCPSAEVAKRALKAGLHTSQIKVYGLPVRPSFIKPVRQKVKGFVTKMEECMGACDCIITKAGPGTIAEAMIRGLPIILNGYIAGQEVGNVPYVVENGCGKFSKLPKEIANIVAEWFGPKAEELKAMSLNAMKLARPEAVFKIVHDLHDLVKGRSFVSH
ncbi:hypothetical protein F2P56_017441 [Juglans regia]|uniref:monogalactosyldiacylglycerol synthase n=1 Tax=Juglans regia TaxID=51240 RepID=A0A833U6B5_JUGRE|nr:hypothetical protein F2P56_017441 [Juglans regia]